MSRLNEFAKYLSDKVISDEFDTRWDICQTCPELTNANRCKQCGCFMKLKVRIKGAKCPLNKW